MTTSPVRADYRTFGTGDPADIVTLAPELTFVEEPWGDVAPKRGRLRPAYQLMARTFAHWPAQARRGAWIADYHFRRVAPPQHR